MSDYVIPSPLRPSLPVKGTTGRFPVRRIYCIGRNYADHAIEMGHDPEKESPFFFQKNAENIDSSGEFPYPPESNDVHFEVEMIVAEIGDYAEDDQLFQLLSDGTVMNTSSFVVIGGEAELIRDRIQENWKAGTSLKESIKLTTEALSGPDKSFSSNELEVALLSRGNGRRAFTRIEGDELNELLA